MPTQRPLSSSPSLRFGAVLLGLQVIVAVISLNDFLLGRKFFAFYDIGSDTFFQFTPALMHLAESLSQGWPSAFSFEIGLGIGGFPSTSPFSLLNAAFGADQVLAMRVWVYVLKLVTGGGFFYAFLLVIGRTPLSATVIALAYSFCGFAVVDGQWDGHATELAIYPLILLGVALALRRGNVYALPLSIGVAAISGMFVFSIGVFLAYAFLADMVAADAPRRQALRWVRAVFPLALLGLALTGPVVGSMVASLLDNPRITGAQALTARVTDQSFSLTDPFLLVSQVAGLFHKDLLGIGNHYQGWMNYLEGPGFSVGLLPLLVIPQLWAGTRSDRRMLIAGAVTVAAFLVVPAIRFAAYGFALPYFRINNLWLSLLLLLLAARALDLVLAHGVRRTNLLITTLALAGALGILRSVAPEIVDDAYLLRVLALLAGAAAALAVLPATDQAAGRWRPAILLVLTAVTAATLSQPSFNHQRHAVTPLVIGYRDATIPALDMIQKYDRSPFYRIEKTYDSVSLCDSLAQGYRGVKSYWFHGSSLVRLFIELGLIPPNDGGLNYTNWLPNFGDRFALYSLVGVKYMISRHPLNWPGFRHLASGYGVHIFENQLAMPLGVVYSHQVSTDALTTLPPERKDLVLLHAVAVDTPLGDSPIWFDPQSLDAPTTNLVEERYFAPVERLKQHGLVIEAFEDTKIAGHVNSGAPGILVFSIPYSSGWSVWLDGVEVQIHQVNYGFIGTPITAGRHRVELRYRPPGQTIGLALAALGLSTLVALLIWRRRRLNFAQETNQ